MLWLWVLPFLMQAGLLAIVMYSILVLSDLQNDLVNPHDCARKLNQLQTPERVLLGLQALTYAVAGRWLMMLVSAAQLAYLLHKAQRGGSSLHAADMISVLPQEKRTRIWRLALCGALLILIVIRLVEDAIKLAMLPLAGHGNTASTRHNSIPRQRLSVRRP